jgi:hypothetical protein
MMIDITIGMIIGMAASPINNWRKDHQWTNERKPTQTRTFDEGFLVWVVAFHRQLNCIEIASYTIDYESLYNKYLYDNAN